MAVTYAYGAGDIVFLNDLWAWYGFYDSASWTGDHTYGYNLLSNAVSFVGASGFATSGTLTSHVISPSPFQQWKTLTFAKTTPAGTTLTVDVLNSSNTVLLSNVASGADLSALGVPAVPIKLRASFATSSMTITPALSDWSITWQEVGPSSVESANSNIENSQQVPSVTLSVENASILEAGGSATLRVTLSQASSEDVTVSLGFTGSATNGGDYTPYDTQVVIPAGVTSGTVLVTAEDDFLVDPNEQIIVDITSVTNGTEQGTQQQTVIIVDDDTAGIMVGAISGDTTEADGTATFTVVLTSEPTADVTIDISSGNTAEGTVSTSSLMFTAADWNTPQTVTVTGQDDFVDDGNIGYTILTAAATSSDANYGGLDAADVTVSNIDDDTAGITVSAIHGDTTEAGGTATFTVVLTSEPTADVTIGISSGNTPEGT